MKSLKELLLIKNIIPFILLLGIVFPVIGQNNNGLIKSSRKFIHVVYFEDPYITESSLVMKYIDPDMVKLPDRVERSKLDQNKFRINENLMNSLSGEKIANKVFENLMVSDGKWTYDNVLERAKINMTDADYQMFSSSAGGIRAGAGRKFYDDVLKTNYILAYSIKDVRTQEQEYDRIDAANRKKERESRTDQNGKKSYIFKPVERTRTGYLSTLNLALIEIQMSDTKLAEMENSIYGETGENSEVEMIQNLMDFNFILRKASEVNVVLSSTASKEKAKEKGYNKEYYISRMLSQNSIGEHVLKLVDNSRDFEITTVLYEAKPGLQIKIGTKEGLKRNDRYFVYEMVQERSGKIVEKRRGAIRAKKPVENKGITTGETTPTRFYQIQGRKLGKGMTVKEEKNRGSFDVGYGDGIYLAATGYVSYLNAAKFNFNFHSFQDSQLPDTSFVSFDFALVFEKDFHFARNFSTGLNAGLFYESYTTFDELTDGLTEAGTGEDPMDEPTPEEEGTPDGILNYTLGANLAYYITPKLKLFGRYMFTPGNFNEESRFHANGEFPLERRIHRYFFGVSMEF